MKMLLITLLSSLFCQLTFASVTGDTIVESVNGPIKIQNLIKGDSIITVLEGSAPYNIKRKNEVLVFTDSSKFDRQRAVVLSYGDPVQTLILSLEQPVLRQDGVLVKARDLSINDLLVNRKGDAVAIHYLALGITDANMVSLAPKSNFVTENLFLANGIYLGSFIVEINLNAQYPIRAFLGQELYR